MNKNIGFFLQNNKQGGLDTFVVNLLNSWPSNHNIYLFCNKSHPGLYFLKKKLDKKIKIIVYDFILRQDLVYNFKFIKKIIIIYLLFIYFFYIIFKIKKIIIRNNINRFMVINGGFPGGEACLAATIAWKILHPKDKHWHNFHSHIIKKFTIFNIKFYFILLINIFFYFSKVQFVSVSKSCLNSLNTFKILLNLKKIYIYNGVKNILYNNHNQITKKLNNNILLLANYSRNKGIYFALDALSKVIKKTNCILIIAGSSTKDEFSKVTNYITKLGLNKNVILKKYQDDPYKLLFNSKILIVTTQEYESFNYSVIEAMAMKKPVVSTNIGGLKEIIIDKNSGYLINKRDLIKFSDKIVSLLKNKSLARKFGQNGYKIYKNNFQAKIMSYKYFEIINNE
jgi:glycosyltransferase involved in cell wall biosynthesis